MAEIDVMIEAGGWEAHPGLEARVAAAAAAALVAANVKTLPSAELAVMLSDDAGVALLNARWRGKNAPTNVLSFPAAAPAKLATCPMIGDIALAFETCRREAEAEGKTFEDHVTHLVVHGTLHLVGFDHETEAEAEAMEGLERVVLAGLGVADPYAGEGEA